MIEIYVKAKDGKVKAEINGNDMNGKELIGVLNSMNDLMKTFSKEGLNNFNMPRSIMRKGNATDKKALESFRALLSAIIEITEHTNEIFGKAGYGQPDFIVERGDSNE